MYLISPEKKQYKANLHSHSTLSDGRRTPPELKEMYKSRGYSVFAFTDHEAPCAHNDLTDEDFIAITGYECYIRIDPSAAYKLFQKEVHLNLFARDPENETLICYNESYCKYTDKERQMAVPHAGSERPREYSPEYINEYIRTARENGYIVAYNHPYWSLESADEVFRYEGLFSFEMCNNNSYLINGLELNGAFYDNLLLRGCAIACHGSDDNHNKKEEGDPEFDSFGAFTMIYPEAFDYSSIISAMENGEMYSSTGPEIYEVSFDPEERILHVECSGAEHIYVYNGGKSPYRVHRGGADAPITSADFTVSAKAPYIRISVVDEKGKKADTRGFFHRELFGEE